MAEGQLVGLVARREAEQLVPEADAEHARAPEQVADRRDLLDERLRVAGAVRQHHAVEAGEVVGVGDVREHRHRGARLPQPAHDRRLGAVVDDRHPHAAVLVVDGRRDRRDGRDERLALHRRLLRDQLERLVGAEIVLVGDGGGAHRAGIADAEDELARVELLERDDALRGQPLRPGIAAAAAHQRGLDPGLRRLEPRVVDAVVADHRRREGDELAREARVGDRLLVAGHGGREDGLAERDAGGADRAGREDGAVLEGEEAVAHAAYTTLPSAIVLTTVPVSVSPSSHELTDFEAKPSSVTVQVASRSSRTRLADSPTSIRGTGSPKIRAGPADIRSSTRPRSSCARLDEVACRSPRRPSRGR